MNGFASSTNLMKPPALSAVHDGAGKVTHVGYQESSNVIFVRYAQCSPSMVFCFYDVAVEGIDMRSATIGKQLERALGKHKKHYAIPLKVYERCAAEDTFIAPTPESRLVH